MSFDESPNEDDDDLEYVYSEDDDDNFVQEYNNGTSTANRRRSHKSSQIVNATGVASTNEPLFKIRKLSTERVATQFQFVESTFGNRNKNHQTISTKNLVPLMEQRILDTAEALCIPEAAAVSLLCDWRWNRERLLEAYMNDQEGTLRKAGVMCRCFPLPEATNAKIGDCHICMESLSDGNVQTLSMPCGHTFCVSCWREYLDNVINLEGATCLGASCPDAHCQERLSQDEVEKAVPNLMEKFKMYRLNNFAGAIGRWCPGPGCDRVACKILSGTNTDSCVTDCNECGTIFCIDCLEEPHAPASCGMLRQWQKEKDLRRTKKDKELRQWQKDKDLRQWQKEKDLRQWKKDKDEGATFKRMTIITKQCPNCQSPIEKNGGCQYIRCWKCRHGFCWMCMGTHHVSKCNAYKNDDDAENEILRSKNKVDQGHDRTQQLALQKLNTFEKLESTEEKNKTSTPLDQGNIKVPQLELPDFLQDANRQLVECRRVLKYSYVFAFYYFANHKLKMTQERFEAHQGTLRGLEEGLSMATAKPLQKIDRQDVVNRTCAIGAFITNVLAYVDEFGKENE
jgi:ariadne-1